MPGQDFRKFRGGLAVDFIGYFIAYDQQPGFQRNGAQGSLTGLIAWRKVTG